MTNTGEIQGRLFGRFHVRSRLRVENCPTDAVPVKPFAEVCPGQSLRRDEMVHDHVGNIEPAQTRLPRAQTPFAHLLAEQRSGFASQTVVPESSEIKAMAAKRHIDSQRRLASKLDRS